MSSSRLPRARRVSRGRSMPGLSSSSQSPEVLALERVARYEYKPLSTDNDEIRVLHISPGEFNDNIYVQLSTIYFKPEVDERYSYEALSYTWGSVDAPVDIFVLHDENIFSIPVTRNCALALRYLRFKEQPRTVWIDAICINQDDLDERSRQVSIIRSIYKAALRVVVWLGPASSDSDLAIKWANEIASEVDVDYRTMQLKPTLLSDNLRRIESSWVLATEDEMAAFTNLLERPYFYRLWVWQEVRSGGANVILVCGSHETTFHAIITAAYYCLLKAVQFSVTGSRLTQRVRFIADMPLVGQNSPLAALDRVRACQCGDQKDRIYSCLAFSDKYTALEVPPNYNLSTARVYVDFVLRWLDVRRDLSFLSYVGDSIPHENDTGVAGLPSWAPDWSLRNTVRRRQLGFASGNSRASVVLADLARLICRGLRVGRVQRRVYSGHDSLDGIAVGEFRQRMSRMLQELLPHPDQRHVSEQLVRALSHDSFAEYHVSGGRELAAFAACERYLAYLLDGSSDAALGADVMNVVSSFSPMRGRSVFLTDSGEIGLGPRETQDGDLVVLLLGCTSLLVLRQPDGDAGPYRVVGSAWCTGFLDGEGILGPLPDQYKTVQVSNSETGGYSVGLRHKTTGDITYEDPRLPAMSSEWEADESRDVLGWRNRMTQEIRKYSQDPRMDADALESRGIRLEEFCLV